MLHPACLVLDCRTVQHCTVAHVLLQKTMICPACQYWTVTLLNITLSLLPYYSTHRFTQPACVELSHCRTSHCYSCITTEHYCFTQPASVGLLHYRTLHCGSCLTTENNALPSLPVLDCGTVEHRTVAPA